MIIMIITQRLILLEKDAKLSRKKKVNMINQLLKNQ